MLWLSGWSCGIGSCRIKADGLHLQSLPILPLVLSEPLLHQSPSATRRRLVGRASALGRDDRPDAMRPNAAVGLLGVEVGVGQKRPILARRTACTNAAPNWTKSVPRPSTAARIM